MLENLKKYKVTLGSQSPRRKELLKGLDIDFTVHLLPGIEESYPAGMQAEEIPLYLAHQKAAAYRETMADNELLITADTIVWTFDRVLGKPKDAAEAVDMLQRLSGKRHEVITGVCLTTKGCNRGFAVTSTVHFAPLTDEEIRYYVDRYRPFDKAGAYGIQEWIGYVGVESIEGSFYNVMGLPVQRLYHELKRF